MITIDQVRDIALSFDNTTEEPHFEKTSFRINKKIFCTFNAKENRICVKLNEIDQDVFCAFDNTVVWKVPNKFGNQGWTLIGLEKLRYEMLEDVLQLAYENVAVKKKKK